MVWGMQEYLKIKSSKVCTVLHQLLFISPEERVQSHLRTIFLYCNILLVLIQLVYIKIHEKNFASDLFLTKSNFLIV